MTAPARALARFLRPDWIDSARCAVENAGPDLFKPRGGLQTSNRLHTQAVADRYCDGCPVLSQCAATADADQLEGVWGGAHRHRETRTGRYTVIPLVPAAHARTHATTPRKAVS